ncbi:hypothetical protein H6P81_020662 [Aristolochia fimbriata]|uniref:Uncharacterized protein n=1 Tax=Aristolochia fimbriata TaxID=158543 RepID=A0AAV7DV14_ARIFI|nr:hypothetical protein H6P81_020662 [Aristolochia fimbriata]
MSAFPSLKLLFLLLPLLLLGCFLAAEALEIGIGIGSTEPAAAPAPDECGDCPPPEPECPPPPPHLPLISDSLARAATVIRRFRSTITDDPKSITKTWVGDSPMDVCTKYRGFFCETPPERKDLTLASIDFNGFSLVSYGINVLLENFTDIALFHANSNNFSGPITPKIANLRYLFELDLSNNKFSGEFPAAVLQVKNLDFLDLRFNKLSGFVPRELFLKPLTVLFINNNVFKQMVPKNLGSSPVRFLTLANNGFTGSISSSIGDAKNTLEEVLFLNNKLSGCLPYEIGFLQKATVFDAGGNSLVGEIPVSFGCLTKVEQLNLARNKLTGEIPEVVCALPRLLNLSLSDNYFTSVGPLCQKLIEKKVLDVRGNCIPGCPSQRSQQECYKFQCSEPVNCPCPPTPPCKLPLLQLALLAPPPPALSHVPSKASYSALHRP